MLRIVSFAAGQTPSKSGLGLVGMPLILSSVAARGNQIVLALGGGPSIGRERFVVCDPDSAKRRKEGDGVFGCVAFQAWGRWSFSPSLLLRMGKEVRQADFVSLHSLYCFPILAGYLLARLYRKPYGLWPHGVLAPFQRSVSWKKKWLYNKLVANRILNQASVLFFSARGERDETKALHLKTRSVIIPHGFDATEFTSLPGRGAFRKRYFNGHTGPLVLFLARVNPKKGVDILVRAMQEIVAGRQDVRLAIVGPFDPRTFEDEVQTVIRRCGLEDFVVMTGPVDPRGRLEALADADVYALPSHAENFGFSVFEAMACRIPVVVSDSINYASEIANTGAGISVPKLPGMFAAAIKKLLESPELRCQMGNQGFSLANSYTWEANGSAVERTVLSILGDRPLPADLSA